MAYFQLTSDASIKRYPYDYHSHFGGILPVDRGPRAEINYLIKYDLGQGEITTTWEKDRELSLLGLLGGNDERTAEMVGQKALFVHALAWMERENPFALLSTRANPVLYERGECAAENIYVACVLLAQRWLLPEEVVAAPASAPTLYRAVRNVVLPGIGPRDEQSLLEYLRYFNRKIYSANKYTPFDDVYKSRSAMMKQLLESPAGRGLYQQWMLATYAYLKQSGVLCNQVAIGVDEIANASAVSIAFNQRFDTRYNLLAHTPSGYISKDALRRDLNDKILPLLVSQGNANIIGLDLLGTENKVSNYATLFEFLVNASGEAVLPFGDVDNSRANAMAVHIHCGEGAGSGSDNRSMIGYCLANSSEPASDGFWRKYSGYIVRCGYNTGLKQADNALGTHGAAAHKLNGVSGLFDEMFRDNSLTWKGTLLHRFDINSALTRERVAYNGKRNAMAITEALEDKPPEQQNGSTYYELLTAPESIYALRLGHDFYYRSYVGAKFPLIAFDTNLGSNAITGAAGLFGSREGYRINKGFRHLEGYIETDVLVAASDAVAYMGSDSLTQAQAQTLMEISRGQGTLREILDNEVNQQRILEILDAALGPIAGEVDDTYGMYKHLVLEIIGGLTSRAYWFQAMARVCTVFQNWRSYLLGADGQGVEHTDLQDEFLRMLFMVAYRLLPAGQTRVNNAMLDTLQVLMLRVAGAYWSTTVSENAPPIADEGHVLVTFEGYKAPSSVVVVRQKRR
ncbi:MAG: hypothetical protein E6Q88_10715 [Lysobacteraceae bacterium]|nr:MAG: hypothetical protein E6Q88_10715 [Xanthomonadaceae bacterium]